MVKIISKKRFNQMSSDIDEYACVLWRLSYACWFSHLPFVFNFAKWIRHGNFIELKYSEALSVPVDKARAKIEQDVFDFSEFKSKQIAELRDKISLLEEEKKALLKTIEILKLGGI